VRILRPGQRWNRVVSESAIARSELSPTLLAPLVYEIAETERLHLNLGLAAKRPVEFADVTWVMS